MFVGDVLVINTFIWTLLDHVSGQLLGGVVTSCRVRLELMVKMADSRGKTRPWIIERLSIIHDETKFNQLKRPQKASFLNIVYVGAVV